MSRYYVIVSLDVLGHFKKGAPPEEEEGHAAGLVQYLLRDALASRDIEAATVTGAIALSPDMIDHITSSLHEAEQKREADWKVQKEVLDRKLTELRAAIDQHRAQKKDVPR